MSLAKRIERIEQQLPCPVCGKCAGEARGYVVIDETGDETLGYEGRANYDDRGPTAEEAEPQSTEPCPVCGAQPLVVRIVYENKLSTNRKVPSCETSVRGLRSWNAPPAVATVATPAAAFRESSSAGPAGGTSRTTKARGARGAGGRC